MDTLKNSFGSPKREIPKSFLETINLETGERKTLVAFDQVIEAPNWTRDDKLIYNSGGSLYAFDIHTSENAFIDTGFATTCNNDHVLSPDESYLGVSHHTLEDGKARIYTLPIQGGSPILIAQQAPSYLHGWSPDGKKLVYCGRRSNQYDIYTIPVNGGVEKQLTDSMGYNDGPEFSPDGRHIWFNSSASGLMQVWRMNVDGSGKTQMTDEESNNWFPHVSPNGEWVVYLAYQKEVAPESHPPNKDVVLRLMPSSGGESRLLLKLFGGQGTINVNSWSKDSKQLAFVSYEL